MAHHLSSHSASQGFSWLKESFRMVWRYKWPWILAFVACGMLSILLTYLWQSIFPGTATVDHPKEPHGLAVILSHITSILLMIPLWCMAKKQYEALHPRPADTTHASDPMWQRLALSALVILVVSALLCLILAPLAILGMGLVFGTLDSTSSMAHIGSKLTSPEGLAISFVAMALGLLLMMLLLTWITASVQLVFFKNETMWNAVTKGFKGVWRNISAISASLGALSIAAAALFMALPTSQLTLIKTNDFSKTLGSTLDRLQEPGLHWIWGILLAILLVFLSCVAHYLTHTLWQKIFNHNDTSNSNV